MAAAANQHYALDSSTALNSPQSKRGPAARGVPSSPWSQVRNPESESDSIVSSSSSSYAAPPSSPSALGLTRHSTSNSSPSKEAAAVAEDSSTTSFLAVDDAVTEGRAESYDNAGGAESGNGVKKPVWNKPSNAAVEVGGAVMGAVSWPALSESTSKASPKPSSSDSLKSSYEGSGAGIASSSQKQVVANDTNASLSPTQVATTRQKSMKRGGGTSGVTANGGFHEPVAPLGQVAEVHSDVGGLPGSSVPETSSRDHLQKGSGHRGGFGSQSRSGNDHSQQRNSYRRGNGTPNPRSDGSYNQNHGGRDRVNHDRNSHRSFNSRDGHMQSPRVVPRGFMPHPPHGSTPFLAPPLMPVRPFGNPMIYADVAPMYYVPAPPPPPPPDSLRGIPIVTPIPPPAMFFPPSDPLLHAKIVTQINYYFSNDNLISDTYLRQNMDEDGWVPIKLIAGFKKVTVLTKDIPLILDALRTSDVVEVQNGKVRKRNDWKRWIMPPSIEFHNVSSPRSMERSSLETHDMLSTNIQSVSLVEKSIKQASAETFLSRSYSGGFNSPFQLSTGEGTRQAPIQAGSELSNFS